MAVWPTELPQTPLREGYSEASGGNVIKSSVDAGRPKRRRRFSVDLVAYSVTLFLNSAQRASLKTFYKTTLTAGTLPFDWIDFDDGTVAEYTFDAPPQFTALGGGKWKAALRLERLE